MFRCPEALFRPDLLGLECVGIDEAIYGSIMKCGIDTRQSLYGNIILSGGSIYNVPWSKTARAEGDQLACSELDEDQDRCSPREGEGVLGLDRRSNPRLIANLQVDVGFKGGVFGSWRAYCSQKVHLGAIKD